MAARSGVAPVVVIVFLLVALAILAPIIAQNQGMTWVPKLSASSSPKPSPDMTHRVWVNRRSGFYYCRKSKFYGRMRPGSSMRQGSALGRGYRPAEGELCP